MILETLFVCAVLLLFLLAGLAPNLFLDCFTKEPRKERPRHAPPPRPAAPVRDYRLTFPERPGRTA